MICDGCRVLNAENAYACANCGAPLSSTVSPETPIVIAGRYRLLNVVGRGGMGTIYKAQDTTLDEVVALKIVRPELARSPQMARRLRSEIRLAHRVAHRNVCRIFEYGDEGEVQYISMEYVDGTDLRRLLFTGGPMRGRDGIALGLQIAHGLAAIHEAGIIHRDLKTSNVMLDESGTAKVMDFGIAKEWRPDVESSTGGLMGTPEYMSPEQVLGEVIDFRSDLYSFGIVLYELFSGDVPFRGPTPGATLVKHVYDPSPFDDPRRSIERFMPADVIAVCRRCLTRQPSDRFPSTHELIEALSALLEGAESRPERVVPPAVARRDWRTLTLGPEVLMPITEAFSRRQRWRKLGRASAWTLAAAMVVGAAYSARRLEPPMDASTRLALEPSLAPAAPATVVSPERAAITAPPVKALDRAAPPRIENVPIAPAPAATAAPTMAPVAPPTVSPSREPDGADVETQVARLRSGSDVERAEAAMALAALGPQASAAVPALSAALRDRDGHVRSCAAQALGRVGPAARDAAPWLADALADRDERVRAAAAEALPKVEAPSPRTLGALMRALGDRNARVRALAAFALGQSREAGPEIQRALQKALKDDETIVRRSAEAALSTLASAGR